MASVTIRNLDHALKSCLRIQAGAHGCSMKDEPRDFLRSALSREPGRQRNLAAAIRARGASIATRNVADFASCGVAVIDPWQVPAGQIIVFT